MAGPSESEAREFALGFRAFLEWVHADRFDDRARNEVVGLVVDHLGAEGRETSVVGRPLPGFEHVNLQHVTRTLLGVGYDPESQPDGPVPGLAPPWPGRQRFSSFGLRGHPRYYGR
jgi:hypothetical protein